MSRRRPPRPERRLRAALRRRDRRDPRSRHAPAEAASASSASCSGPGRSIGNNPSHRAARRTGLRLGQFAATQTGIRGRCTGRGRNAPFQNPLSRSKPSSSRRARSRGSIASPYGTRSSVLPSPTPSVRRPLLRWSSVTVSRATFWTRLRESGVIIGPIRRLSVAEAMALSATHGSATARSAGGYAIRSHRNRPSQPRDSATPASSAKRRGSASSSNGARYRPRFMARSLGAPRRRSTTWRAPTRRTIPPRTARALDPGP